ncbi:hypothetical protein GF342_02945 [Candidatus Woesearchaeota archaeon]|nr:hypothetical protein [Candidatus Woesearchaeota archaeon]
MNADRETMKEHKKLHAFSKRSLLRIPLLPLLGPVAYALSPGIKECVKQYPEAAGTVEFTLSRLARTVVRHPIKVIPLLSTITDWVTHYFGAQREQKNSRQFLIYTTLDDTIPFRPEWDTLYTYMISQIGYLTEEVLQQCSTKEVKEVGRMFTHLTKISAEVFNTLPTRMVRLRNHDRISLRAVQAIDDPLNCCPSLHIAYSVLIDNLMGNVLDTKSSNPQLWRDVRIASTGMFDSVLYTKQHALVCVATGILAAEIAYKHFHPRRPFNDFADLFGQMSGEVPYKEVKRLYRDVQKHYSRTRHLPTAIKALFDQEEYPLVSASQAENEYVRLLSKETVQHMRKT